MGTWATQHFPSFTKNHLQTAGFHKSHHNDQNFTVVIQVNFGVISVIFVIFVKVASYWIIDWTTVRNYKNHGNLTFWPISQITMKITEITQVWLSHSKFWQKNNLILLHILRRVVNSPLQKTGTCFFEGWSWTNNLFLGPPTLLEWNKEHLFEVRASHRLPAGGHYTSLRVFQQLRNPHCHHQLDTKNMTL